jgi:hypothetical protein
MTKRDEDQLPKPLAQFAAALRGDRKKLLKEPAWADPAQLRQFLGQYTLPRVEEMFRLLAGIALEAYNLAALNSQEIRRLHAFTVEELNELGANLDDVEPPGVSQETLDLLHETFFSLGTLIQEKYSADKALVEAYQRASEALNRTVEELLSDDDAPPEDGDGDGGEETGGPDAEEPDEEPIDG